MPDSINYIEIPKPGTRLQPPRPLLTFQQWTGYLIQQSEEQDKRWEKKLSDLKQEIMQANQELLEKIDNLENEAAQLKTDLTEQAKNLELIKKTCEILLQPDEQKAQLETVKEQKVDMATPEEVIQVQNELDTKAKTTDVLEQEEVFKQPIEQEVQSNLMNEHIVHLNEKIEQLERENLSLKSQIKYLWNLFLSFIKESFSTISKNQVSFFSKKSDLRDDAVLERQDNTKTHNF